MGYEFGEVNFFFNAAPTIPKAPILNYEVAFKSNFHFKYFQYVYSSIQALIFQYEKFYFFIVMLHGITLDKIMGDMVGCSASTEGAM